MKVVILAAGKGTRLRPLTQSIPKGLVEINSKPILTYIINSVKEFVSEIIIVVGHLGNKIEEYYKYEFESIPIRYVYQNEQLGTGHALFSAKQYLDGDFLVMNGDDIYHTKDIEKLTKVDFGVLGIEVDNWQQFGVLVKNISDDSLKEIIEKPTTYISSLINTGVYKFNLQIFSHILIKSQRGEYEIIDYLNYLVQNKFNVEIVNIEKYWFPINSLEQLYIAENFFKINR